jgi:hypothetical protein
MAENLRIKLSTVSSDMLDTTAFVIAGMPELSLYTEGRVLAERKLTDNTPWVISLQSLPNVAAVLIATNAAITAALTPTTGSVATLPVDSLLVLSSTSNPFTALTITRANALPETSVTVVLLQSAP